MNQKIIDGLAKKIWAYHHLNRKLQKADCIIALGNNDVRVAKEGANLWLKGWAPLLIFSGGFGGLTPPRWEKTEADKFAEIAIGMGVPPEKILIENKSTNTGENILFTKALLAKRKINIKRTVVVQTPYMERRAYATFKKIWPEIDVIVTSPPISYEKYANKEISKDDFINIMVGDLQRIKIYPKKGFQIHQKIPADAWNAYKQLLKLGYNKHLIN